MEEFSRIDDAYCREKQVQGWSRRKKQALIKGEFEKLPVLAQNTLRPLRQAQGPDRQFPEPVEGIEGGEGEENHEKYMRIALKQAKEALEQGEFPVGAVFVHQDQIVASGKRFHTREQTESVNEIDHAEILALRNLLGRETVIPMDEIVVYATMEPCLMCYSTMLLNGIRNIVYGYEDVMGGGTNLPLDQLNPLYTEMKVSITPHILRQQSLELFQQFFANPENLYWKDSLLANYTLSQ